MERNGAFIYSLETERTPTQILSGEVEISNEQQAACDELYSRVEEHDVTILSCKDDEFAHLFGSIVSPPKWVFFRGNRELLFKNSLAIVGPRKPSIYARDVMHELFSNIKDYDVITISGGAPGIDMLAHTLSLQNNIPTIVVLGAGLKYAKAYNKNHFLQKVVDQGGLVISEFGLNQSPQKRTFPQRNRLIVGLSSVVFVPSAGIRSGTRISIDFALQMHKHVYTVPASIFDHGSEGTNFYIEHKKIRSLHNLGDRLADYFRPIHVGSSEIVIDIEAGTVQAKIYEELKKSALSLDQLLETTGFPLHELLAAISILELRGYIVESCGMYKKL